MAGATLLTLVQNVTMELNLSSPTSVIGNQDRTVLQVLAVLKRAGKELIKLADWEFLQKKYSFTTNYLATTGNITAGSPTITNIPSTAGLSNLYYAGPSNIFNQDTQIVSVGANTVTVNQNALQTNVGQAINFTQQIYPLPLDYETILRRTFWDKNRRWEMLGPESPSEWEYLTSGYISTGPRLRWRIFGGFFQIWPYLNTNELLRFEYRSNSSITSPLGVAQTDYITDSDINLLDETVLTNLAKLKYFEVKGFDTSSLQKDYDRMFAIAKANDGGFTTLNMSPSPAEVLLGLQNIPDSGYGS